MARPIKTCAFCDAKAVTKGGEHLWDDWINQEINPKTRFNATKSWSKDLPPVKFSKRGLKEKIPTVCTPCNGGWMSALTARMKERFQAAILDGAPFSLDIKGAHLLTAFTLMKAIVKDCSHRDEPFFTRDAREQLRKTLAIPPLVKVWFSMYEGAARLNFRSNLYAVTPDTPGPLYGLEFFCYTYVVKNLTLQLLAPRWRDIRHRDRPLITLSPDSYWQPAATQFWPFNGSNLSWPPEKILSDRVIEQFINRFQVPISLSL
ncbi:MAG: hypothetical protein ABSD70_05325 [Terracidiphilus sp.]|jgi:hypothetical protein